jgi:hypothetical protein
LTPAAESDLTEELAQHLEERYRELMQGGAEEAEAYRQAAAELEDPEVIRGLSKSGHRMPSREAAPVATEGSGNWCVDFAQDLRFAGRTMRKNPVFVLFVMLTLGLGIGANTTVFTLINTVLLHPLPVPNSSELVSIGDSEEARTARSAAPLPISYLNLKDYRARNGVFGSLAGYTHQGLLRSRRRKARSACLWNWSPEVTFRRWVSMPPKVDSSCRKKTVFPAPTR